MGFIDDVETIAAATPATRQTLLFSATLDGAIDKVAAKLLKSPKRIQIASQKARLDNIEQRLHYVDDMSHKNRLLNHVLRDEALKQAIVFTATKRDADTLADNLYAQGYAAAALHGDMNQRERTRTLTKLRSGGLRVLVATDVAARGIDIADITHVINFDLPKFAEDYVHRIGRTGRAGAAGIAVSFASSRDSAHLTKIERYTGQQIASHIIPGLEPRIKPRPQTSGFKGAAPSVTQKRKRAPFASANSDRQNFNATNDGAGNKNGQNGHRGRSFSQDNRNSSFRNGNSSSSGNHFARPK